MSVIAYLFHWQPSEMDALEIDELMAFYDEALKLHKAANKP